jgi:DNA repair exonuclease SbcCD ATPase subunit
MARKPARRLPRAPRLATYAQLQEARAELRKTMAALDDLTERFTKITDIQFERIAQIQAELDEVRTAWTRPAARRKGS